MSKYFTKTSFFEDFWRFVFFIKVFQWTRRIQLWQTRRKNVGKKPRVLYRERKREKNIISPEVFSSKRSYGAVECSYENADRNFLTKSWDFLAQCPIMVDGGQKIQFFSGTNFTLKFSWRLAERSLDEAAGKLPKQIQEFLLIIRKWQKKHCFTK